MKTITYSLKNNDANSDQYYSDIDLFTDSILSEADRLFLPLIKLYMNHLDLTGSEKLRSKDEYMYEFISLGVYWRIYSVAALDLNQIAGSVLSNLYNLRRKYRSYKKYIDSVRGVLSTIFLDYEDKGIKEIPVINAADLEKLFIWLEATGEFKEEVNRFRMWQEYLDSFNAVNMNEYLRTSVEFAAWFEIKSEVILGQYTENVQGFRENELDEHKWTEDYIFCKRKRVEYHLEMFGAEVMNRAFRSDFQNTSKKAVLLPACMRLHNDEKCRAQKKSLDLICTGCSKDCRINQYTKLGKQHGFEVHIIPHSSDFIKWLQTWGVNKNIGVVGVACILNLITGGYEMKGLDIAAQCVLLDYCGCKNHWDKEGIATDINVDELLRVLECKNENLALAV